MKKQAISKQAINNINLIYQKDNEMKKPTIFEIIREPFYWEKFGGNIGLKYLIVMTVINSNNLTIGYAFTEKDEFVNLLKRELKIFDYNYFRSINTIQLTFNEEDVQNAINDILGELTKTNISRAIN